MNEDLHNIDDLFRKALEENQELPAASVWDNIDKTLDKKKVVSISKKYTKLKWAAAALLLFSLGMAMYTLHIRKQNSELVKQNKEGKNILKQNLPNKISSEDSSSSNTNNTTPLVDANDNNKVRKQLQNVDTSVANSNITISNNKNLPANKEAADKEVVVDKNIILSNGKANENIASLNRKRPAMKDTVGLKMQVAAGSIDSNNTNNKKDEQSTLSYSKNDIDKTKGTNNSAYHIITDKQKNIETSSLAPDLKDIFLLPIQTPVYKNDNRIISGDIALNRHVSFSKGTKINYSSNSLFSATVFFSPDIVSADVKDDHPRFREEERNVIEKDEQIKFSSTFGILVDYNIGKNWKVESGLTYSSRKTNIQPKTIYARPDNNGNINYRFNCSAGYSYITVKSPLPPAFGDSINALASTNNLQYIGLPLYAKYIFTTGRFSILPGAGISFNFLTKGKIETTITSATGSKIPSTDKIQGLKSMYINGAVGVGLQYKLNRTFSLSFEPTFRFAISSINKDASVKTNLNSIGLTTGIVFKL
ncbi:MAG TPA: outer membrane beta-barrel protein [Ginsengibacter sp.]